MCDPTLSARRRHDRLCDEFESLWKHACTSGDKALRPEIEKLLAQVDREERKALFCGLVEVELELRRQCCREEPNVEEYAPRFPEYVDLLPGLFEKNAQPAAAQIPQVSGNDTIVIPERIGGYVILDRIGEGAFGAVFRARDEELQRDVAIKIPGWHEGDATDHNKQLMKEAQAVAALQHPNIVRVFRVAKTDEFPCVLISEFIDGMNLAERIERDLPDIIESVRIIETIADSLHFAHAHDVIHRDVKPANILIDSTGKAYLTDFGLALTHADYGKGGPQGCTPAYMSPEQARGEGHRVRGTSDIFSLGAVFFELLTGQRAFDGDQREVREQVINSDPRSPRLINEHIPRELERICMKALSKRAADRFPIARDMARELKAFREHGAGTVGVPTGQISAPRVVPKGLRSFEAADADFFIELTPGPCDRLGVPDCIRFWKSRIEDDNNGESFRVGLMYGVSGSGKSSLVKAGIIPRLEEHVIPIFVDATHEELEQLIVDRLAHLFPDLDTSLGFADVMARLRREKVIPTNKKIVVFIDQFEQWLHANHEFASCELVSGFRQCDGHQLQAVLLIRDDFWIPISRFMNALEIPIVEGQNAAAVDSFGAQHSKKVLLALGHAHDRLQYSANGLPQEQEAFVDHAIRDLSEDGRVSPVQLALFCEVVKYEQWDMETYRKIGGAANSGRRLLEKTFAGPAAHEPQRIQKKAAMSVLEALMPAMGTDIKGRRRSEAELKQASGYNDRDEFRALMRTLDGKLRIVTPVDSSETRHSTNSSGHETKLYQLTHDYLVPNIRSWINDERGMTFRGQAQSRLEVMTQLWKADTRHSFRPNLWDLAWCWSLTSPKNWTAPQRTMMHGARYHFLLRALVVSGIIVMLGVGIGRWIHSRSTSNTLVDNLEVARLDEISSVMMAFEEYKKWTIPALKDRFEQTRNEDLRFRYALALAYLNPTGTSEIEYLFKQLPEADLEKAKVDVLFDLARSSRVGPHRVLLDMWNKRDERTDATPASAARVALALSLFGVYEPMISILRADNPNPTEQTRLIHELSSRGCDPSRIADSLEQAVRTEEDAILARHLCLALGEYPMTQVNEVVREAIKPALIAAYNNEPDQGLGGALRWLFWRWNIPIPSGGENASGIETGCLGNEFVVVDIGSCRIGSPPDEPKRDPSEEELRNVAVNRRIAVATKEFTIANLKAAFPKGQFPELQLDRIRGDTENCPASGISFYMAARICNRLSELEGIPVAQWCFVPNQDDKYEEGMSLAPNYLTLEGYRMPTAAEWEFFARAGTTTRFPVGKDVEYLGKYGWYNANATGFGRPVGFLKPNRFGLFDTIGNVFEWTLTRRPPQIDSGGFHFPTVDVAESRLVIRQTDEFFRVGGGAGSGDKSLRAANRSQGAPRERHKTTGLRVVRTIDVLGRK